MRFILSVASCVIALAACEGPATSTPELRTVVVSPGDMTTLVGRSTETGLYPIRIVNQHGSAPERIAGELESWNGNVRVVTWPDGAVVPGSWRGEHVLEAGISWTFVLVFLPDYDLSRGWYAVQLNLAEIEHGRRQLRDSGFPVIDGWTTSRFHVGSLPIVRAFGTVVGTDRPPPPAGDDETAFMLQASEPVYFEREIDLIDVIEATVDGAPLSCWWAHPESTPSTVGPSDAAFPGLALTCDRAPPGSTVDIRIRDWFVGTGGERFYDLEGHSPPHWTFHPNEPIDSDPTDAFFEITSGGGT